MIDRICPSVQSGAYFDVWQMLKFLQSQEVFQALADPTRRRVLKLLRPGSLTPGELATHFDITKGSLSHHFNILLAAHLVRRERRGQQIVYSLNSTLFQEMAQMFMELFGTETRGSK